MAQRRHWLVLVSIAAAYLTAGCAATSRQTVIKPSTLVLQPGARAAVELGTSGPASPTEIELLRREIVRRLDATGKFAQVEGRPGAMEKSGVIVKCDVTRIRRVGSGMRVFLGAMAGRARVDVHTTLIDAASGNTVGEADVMGASSGGTIFAGTTEQAIDKAAEAVANFVTPRI